ncbi:hypothetical protein B0H13DRAFT_2328046 [Mycena leptocephala]|nr:hypothetical protein B0H13DRAFT_2328046 [Mycena leptocephala]
MVNTAPKTQGKWLEMTAKIRAVHSTAAHFKGRLWDCGGIAAVAFRACVSNIGIWFNSPSIFIPSSLTSKSWRLPRISHHAAGRPKRLSSAQGHRRASKPIPGNTETEPDDNVWESDTESDTEDTDHFEAREAQPKPRTYDEREERWLEKRDKAAAKHRAAEM